MSMKLTAKQEIFTLDLSKGMYQRDAYIHAYQPKYAIEIIDANASRLASNEKVIARLEELRKAAADSTIATVIERKQVLTEIIRGRFSHFIDTEGNIVELTEENLRSAALQEVKIVEFVGGKDGRAKEKSTTIKLYSPMTAIDLLNKMGGDYPTIHIDLDWGKPFKELLARLYGYIPPGPVPQEIPEEAESLATTPDAT